MDWKRLLKDLNLVNLKASLKTEQAGVVNIKVENHNYYMSGQNPEAVKQAQRVNLTPELEAEVKSKAEKSLLPVGQLLNWANEATGKEIVILSTTAALIDSST